MALEFILLGMLRDPASGYDLRRAFDEGPRHFWSAELSQIYPTLQRMQKRGWLSCRHRVSRRGPKRREYRRTAAGTRALHQWLRGKPDFGAERLAYIGQLVFLGELGDSQRTLEFLEELRRRMAEFQAGLEAAEAELRRERKEAALARWNDDDFHELLCLRMGIRSQQAKAAACDECIELVRARARVQDPSHA